MVPWAHPGRTVFNIESSVHRGTLSRHLGVEKFMGRNEWKPATQYFPRFPGSKALEPGMEIPVVADPLAGCCF